MRVPGSPVPLCSAHGYSRTSTTRRSNAAPVRPTPYPLPHLHSSRLAPAARRALPAGSHAPARVVQTSGPTRSPAGEARLPPPASSSTKHARRGSYPALRRWLSTPAQTHAAPATSKSVVHLPLPPPVPLAAAGSCPPARGVSPAHRLSGPLLQRSPQQQPPPCTHPQRRRAAEKAPVPGERADRSSRQSLRSAYVAALADPVPPLKEGLSPAPGAQARPAADNT